MSILFPALPELLLTVRRPRISRDASQTVLQTHVLNSQLGAFVDVFGKPFQGYVRGSNITLRNDTNSFLGVQ